MNLYWKLFINSHQSLFFIICINFNHHCHYYWTSKSLLNFWECIQDLDITNKWVVYFVISWNSLFSHYLVHWNILMDIANSINLCIFKSTNQVPTRYLDNSNNSNSVINLIFLWLISSEFDNYTIWPEWRLLPDHTPLTINIAIFKE